MMNVLLKPGDVFLTRGTGLLSRLIRVCTQSFGEKRSKVNHVGVVVEEGSIQTAVVVEALIKVRKHLLWKTYGPPKKDHVAVYRAKNLKPEEIEIIVAEANNQVGRPYGFGKIIAHFLDWLLTGAYVFRRFTRVPHLLMAGRPLLFPGGQALRRCSWRGGPGRHLGLRRQAN
jgi:cell wall-associated NlpC family hydrolase